MKLKIKKGDRPMDGKSKIHAMPVHADPLDTVPRYMLPNAGKGLENLGATDFGWQGVDGKLDVEKLLAERGYEARASLDYILLALIDGAAASGDKRKRLASARRALGVGKGEDRRVADDYTLLHDIGFSYLTEHVRLRQTNIAIEPIARKCLKRRFPNGRKGGTELSQVKRLSDKFRADKDLILARLTFDKIPERITTLRKIGRILELMRELGIKVSLDDVRPVEVPSS